MKLFFVAQHVIAPNPCEGVEAGSLKWFLGCWIFTMDWRVLLMSVVTAGLMAWALRRVSLRQSRSAA